MVAFLVIQDNLVSNLKTAAVFSNPMFRSGKKYILRTDIMYRKIGEKKMDEKQEKAIAMIQEAERLEVCIMHVIYTCKCVHFIGNLV